MDTVESLFAELRQELETYLTPEQIRVIYQAYRLAADAVGKAPAIWVRDGHGLERRHSAQGVDGQRHVAEGHRRDPDGLRRVRRPARAFLPVRGRGVMLEPLPGVGARPGQDGDDRDPGETAPPAPRSGFGGRGGHALRDLVRRGRRAFRDVVGFKGLVHP